MLKRTPFKRRARPGTWKYSRLRKDYLLRHQPCQVAKSGVLGSEFLYLPATQIHHRRGRVGPLLIDTFFWMAVSAEGHLWIHQNPEEARKRGWIQPADNKAWEQWLKNH